MGHRKDKELGSIPLVMNLSAMSVTGSLGDLIKQGTSWLTGTNFQSNAPADVLSPLPSGIVASITGQDPFTGRAYPAGEGGLEIFIRKALGNVAGIQTARRFSQAGKEDKSTVLYPYTKQDVELKTFLGGFAKTPVNPKVARSRGISAEAAGKPRVQRIVMRFDPAVQEYRDAWKKVSISPFPKALSDAMKKKLAFEKNRAEFRDAKGHKLEPFDRLIADANFAVRTGYYTEPGAKQLLKFWATMLPSQQSTTSSQLASILSGSSIISSYRTMINSQLESKGEKTVSDLPSGD